MATNTNWEVLHDSLHFLRKMKVQFILSLLLFFPIAVAIFFAFAFVPVDGTFKVILIIISMFAATSLFVCIINELNYLYNTIEHTEQITFTLYTRRFLKRYIYYFSNFLLLIPVLGFFVLLFSLILFPVFMMVNSENTNNIYGLVIFLSVIFCLKIVFPYVTYEGNNMFTALPKALSLFFSNFKSTIVLFLFSIFIQFISFFMLLWIYNFSLAQYIVENVPEYITSISFGVIGICTLLGLLANIWGISLFNFQYLRLKKEADEKKRLLKQKAQS